MGTAFGELGVTQSPLWAENGCSTEIRSRFTQGTREWEMVLWVSGSGSIEGRCGGKVFGRDVHGVYRPGNDLEVRLGGRMFGETLRLAMQSRAHISGRIVGMGDAIGAATVSNKPVVAIEGDSAFSGMEIETLCRYHLPVVILVFNNGGIYQGDKVGTAPSPTGFVPNARYDVLIEAFGGRGYHVEDAAGLTNALTDALAAAEPALPYRPGGGHRERTYSEPQSEERSVEVKTGRVLGNRAAGPLVLPRNF